MGWSEIYGHNLQKSFFQRVIAEGRLSHAYLFSGPPHVGKSTFVKELARRLNCLSPSEDGACGTCQSCRFIEAGSHPDVISLVPQEGTIVIEQVRQFTFQLGFKRVMKGYRVGIVFSAECFSKEEVQNCLLKSIEEPAEGSVIFLVTSQVHSLLPTILSRCQQVFFTPLQTEEIKQYLMREKAIPEKKAQDSALVSMGSIGRAQAILEGKTGVQEKAFFLCKHVLHSEGMLSLGPWFIENKENLAEILPLFGIYLRDCLLIKMEKDGSDHFLFDPSKKDEFRKESQQVTIPWLRQTIVQLEQLMADLSQNGNIDIAVIHFLLQLREDMKNATSRGN
ncbi:MAG: DNA polymerase III subunit delta' [Candidatus Atribacteria bacterium]|nr:DNA polymerase III subunit delta' [Candidatus Atribacteria bacterium]